MSRWLIGKIRKITYQSPTTRLFEVEVQVTDSVKYKAGQFVVMDLPIHEKRLQRWRSYSIANPPNGSNILEFSIVKLEDGLATSYLFTKVNVGDELTFKKPSGVFVLPNDVSDKELVFVCTGTGVAPFRAMIFDLVNNNKSFKSIHLIFGTRTEDGILFKKEFEELAKKNENFTYDVALSRQEHPDYHHGYVHGIYSKKYSKPKKDVSFYLCGWSKMIDEAKENIVKKIGFKEKQVIYELYG